MSWINQPLSWNGKALVTVRISSLDRSIQVRELIERPVKTVRIMRHASKLNQADGKRLNRTAY
jgi:hypothetical protein